MAEGGLVGEAVTFEEVVGPAEVAQTGEMEGEGAGLSGREGAGLTRVEQVESAEQIDWSPPHLQTDSNKSVRQSLRGW